ncbi:hypothetical protein FRC20_008497 [Serendipita sp. 405]|nr:hypothetical protein FRC20_008497 [Serendipita sp. 405]
MVFHSLTHSVTFGITYLLTASLAQNISTPLVNFQVNQPLAVPKSVPKCEVELVHHLFANSYYQPAITVYTPPTSCGPIGSWSAISLNWTATSNGTQYDRLAGVTLSNVEIWRTSTSEPTPGGIVWTVLKDVTKYIPLFAEPGTLIVDLNNVIDPKSGLTGEYDVRLTATFHQSDWLHPKAPRADLIFPLSTLSGDQSNVFAVPPAGNTTVVLPRNAVTAIVEIQATGNGQEEFWYFNVPDEYLPYIPPETTYGKGSFREVRVLVDGLVAGVAFPYPVLFTGAFVPTVWRPIVAYGAYDAPTYNVDLTPFIPLLTDGSPHTVTLDAISDEPDHALNPNWYLSGNIKVSLDESNKPTAGNITRYEVPSFRAQHTITPIGQDSYNMTVDVSQSVFIEATIVTGSGARKHITWKQNFHFSNVQSYTNNASASFVTQRINGNSISTHNLLPVLLDNVDFPLSIDFEYVADETGSGWVATFDQQYNRNYLPSPWEVSTTIRSSQHANGTYIRYPNNGFNRTANGTTFNEFHYVDGKLNSYSRLVDVTNNTVTKDRQGGTLTWDFWPFVGRPWSPLADLLDGLIGFEAVRLPNRNENKH